MIRLETLIELKSLNSSFSSLSSCYMTSHMDQIKEQLQNDIVSVAKIDINKRN